MPLYDLGCPDCGMKVECVIALADFDKPLPICDCGSEMQRLISAPRVMSDIEPYQAVGVDVESGTAPMITSRSHHREYLKRNNYVELGNDVPTPKVNDEIRDGDIAREVKRAVDQVGAKL